MKMKGSSTSVKTGKERIKSGLLLACDDEQAEPCIARCIKDEVDIMSLFHTDMPPSHSAGYTCTS